MSDDKDHATEIETFQEVMRKVDRHLDATSDLETFGVTLRGGSAAWPLAIEIRDAVARLIADRLAPPKRKPYVTPTVTTVEWMSDAKRACRSKDDP